jgi:hypothetical protein
MATGVVAETDPMDGGWGAQSRHCGACVDHFGLDRSTTCVTVLAGVSG